MILTFDKVSWANNLFRNLFGTIDKLIYSLIGWIMQGIFNLAGLTASNDLIKTIYDRIYVILAIFMLFKLSISFLQYLVSPDSMNDKERGVGKLVTRVVIMLVMIVALPIFFFEPLIEYDNGQAPDTILVALQKGILKTLPRIILGFDDEVGGTVSSSSKENGEILALGMLKAFYFPEVCNENGPVESAESCSDASHIATFDEFGETITTPSNANTAYYEFQYMWPLTTVAGIFLAVTLLGIAIDIAIRTFKMIILQVIAPVPVMSYIDPKASKDGAFGSWVKSFTSTYLEIFIKLGTVYILLLLFSRLFESQGIFEEKISPETFGDSAMAKNFVLVFLMIGLFKFIKDAPKFIKEALGMKDSGKGGIFGGLSALGAAAGTIGGAAAGMIGGAASGVAAARAAGQGNVMAALKGAGGAVTGIGRGGYQGAKGAAKGNLLKGTSAALAAQNAVTQKKLAAAAAGSTLGGRLQAQAQQFFTGQTAADRDEEMIKNYDDAISKSKSFKDVLGAAAADSNASFNGRNLKDFNSTLAAAKAGDKAALDKLKAHGFSKAIQTTTTDAKGRKIKTTTYVGDLNAAIYGADDYKKAYEKDYYAAAQTAATTGTHLDNKSSGVLDAADAATESMKIAGISSVGGKDFSAESVGAFIGEATAKKTAYYKSGSKYRVNKANKDAIKKGK